MAGSWTQAHLMQTCEKGVVHTCVCVKGGLVTIGTTWARSSLSSVPKKSLCKEFMQLWKVPGVKWDPLNEELSCLWCAGGQTWWPQWSLLALQISAWKNTFAVTCHRRDRWIVNSLLTMPGKVWAHVSMGERGDSQPVSWVTWHLCPY